MERFAIYLTEEQNVAVRNLFESNEWELNMTKLNVNKSPSLSQEKRKQEDNIDNIDISCPDQILKN